MTGANIELTDENIERIAARVRTRLESVTLVTQTDVPDAVAYVLEKERERQTGPATFEVTIQPKDSTWAKHLTADSFKAILGPLLRGCEITVKEKL